MAHTVLAQDTRAQYTASIGETNFSYPLKIFEDDNLKVYLTPNGQVPDPVIDILTLNVDYTVTGAGDTGGGDIVLVTPATAGDIITIELDIPPDRLFDYSVGGEFTGESINTQLDKITKLIQQNKGINENRQLTYKVTDTLTTGDVTLPYLEINQFWMKNASGGLVNVTLEQNPDWSTLRTELLNDQSGTAGSKIVGHYSSVNSSTTVSDELEDLQTRIEHALTFYSVTAGTPDTYTATIAHFPTAYTEGITLELKMHATNVSDTPTINVNGLGVRNLENTDGFPVLTGKLVINRAYTFIYTGNSFRITGIPQATYVNLGTLLLADDIDMKAATDLDNAVAPGMMIEHPGVPKLLLRYDGGTPAILNSWNVTSVNYNGVGDYTINFTNAFTDSNYYSFISWEGDAADYMISVAPINASSAKILVNANGVRTDAENVNVVIYGELA